MYIYSITDVFKFLYTMYGPGNVCDVNYTNLDLFLRRVTYTLRLEGVRVSAQRKSHWNESKGFWHYIGTE